MLANQLVLQYSIVIKLLIVRKAGGVYPPIKSAELLILNEVQKTASITSNGCILPCVDTVRIHGDSKDIHPA